MFVHHTKQPAGKVRVTERVEDPPADDRPDGRYRLVARAGATMSIVEAARLGIPADKLEAVGRTGEVALAAYAASDDPEAAEAAAREAARTAARGDTPSDDDAGDGDLRGWLTSIEGVGVAQAEKIAEAFDDVDQLAAVDDLDQALGDLDGVGPATVEKVAAAVRALAGDTPSDDD